MTDGRTGYQFKKRDAFDVAFYGVVLPFAVAAAIIFLPFYLWGLLMKKLFHKTRFSFDELTN